MSDTHNDTGLKRGDLVTIVAEVRCVGKDGTWIDVQIPTVGKASYNSGKKWKGGVLVKGMRVLPESVFKAT